MLKTKRLYSETDLISLILIEIVLAYCLATYLIMGFMIFRMGEGDGGGMLLISAPVSLPILYLLETVIVANMFESPQAPSIFWSNAGIFLIVFLFSAGFIHFSFRRPIIGYFFALLFTGVLSFVAIWFR